MLHRLIVLLFVAVLPTLPSCYSCEQPDIAPYATGSVLVSFGLTRVICAATIEPNVPAWMKQQKVPGGWLTAEYSMLPYSTLDRKPRDISRGKRKHGTHPPHALTQGPEMHRDVGRVGDQRPVGTLNERRDRAGLTFEGS